MVGIIVAVGMGIAKVIGGAMTKVHWK